MTPSSPPISQQSSDQAPANSERWVTLHPAQGRQIVGGYWAYHMAATPSIRTPPSVQPSAQSAGYRYGYYGLPS